MTQFKAFTICFLVFSGVGSAQVDLGDPKIGLVVDAERVKANGIRSLEGKFVTIFTDLPRSKDINELAMVFDQAVPQWMTFFNVDQQQVANFRATGFLIKDKSKFQRANLLPNGLPAFKNGYTYGTKTFWMFDQPSEFMRRQLMLHEGTHAFIFSHLGDQIPPWYNEGLAELFASHQWVNQKLTTCYTIRNRDESKFWGRPKAIRDLVAKNEMLSIADVMKLDNASFLRVDPYAWVWAFSSFLYHHPEYRVNFQKLSQAVAKKGQVEIEFKRYFGSDLSKMEEDWKAYLHELDYGMESAFSKIVHDKPRMHKPRIPKISASMSWQNSGLKVVAGENYLIRSTGRFTIRVTNSTNEKPVAWPCEPNGVSVNYYLGSPLGKLMAIVKADDQTLNFQSAQPIGLSANMTPNESGTLYFRVNESPVGLKDNDGDILISVQKR